MPKIPKKYHRKRTGEEAWKSLLGKTSLRSKTKTNNFISKSKEMFFKLSETEISFFDELREKPAA